MSKPTDTARTSAGNAASIATRVALVTGASRGLGAAIAEGLASRGWHVVAVARTSGGLEELDDRIRAVGGQATLAPMDITHEDAMRHLCRQIHDRWGRLGLWVHSAIHAPPLSPASHIAGKDLDRTLAINVRATASLIALITPLLTPTPADDSAIQRPAAVFFDDPAAGTRFHGLYGASKAAQIALARSWQAETTRHGPRVVIHTPAPMPTALRARFAPGEDRSRLAPCGVEAARVLAQI